MCSASRARSRSSRGRPAASGAAVRSSSHAPGCDVALVDVADCSSTARHDPRARSDRARRSPSTSSTPRRSTGSCATRPSDSAVRRRGEHRRRNPRAQALPRADGGRVARRGRPQRARVVPLLPERGRMDARARRRGQHREHRVAQRRGGRSERGRLRRRERRRRPPHRIDGTGGRARRHPGELHRPGGALDRDAARRPRRPIPSCARGCRRPSRRPRSGVSARSPRRAASRCSSRPGSRRTSPVRRSSPTVGSSTRRPGRPSGAGRADGNPEMIRLGGADGTRTHDLLHAMQALYQLSYAPEGRSRYQQRIVNGRSGSSGRYARRR